MSQYLVLPINDLEMTAGYQNELYRKSFGFSHYGVDCVSATGVRTVYACGDGEVIAAGQDGAAVTGAASRLGNVIVIVYRDVLCPDGTTRNLAARCYHFDAVLVKAGERVTKDTVIGLYGNTGANSNGAHLHIEFDTDIKYPCLAAGVKAGGKIINRPEEVKKYGLVDSTLRPAKVWFVDNNQSMKARSLTSGWVLPEDVPTNKLPELTSQPPEETKPDQLAVFLAELETLIEKYKANGLPPLRV